MLHKMKFFRDFLLENNSRNILKNKYKTYSIKVGTFYNIINNNFAEVTLLFIFKNNREFYKEYKIFIKKSD
jgi:hypothetical protein